MKRPHKDESLWQNRFERLVAHLDDIEIIIRKGEITKCKNRAWDAPETLYVSWALESCDDEEHAIKNFGAGKYDTYQLIKKGDEQCKTK